MKQKIDHGFILAAGMGTRLRPYTDHCPKPMVELGGRPMIDHVLDRLEDAGVTEVTVNLHYRGEQLESYLKKRTSPKIIFSHEEILLETGGGIKKALPLIGDAPFFCVAGDSIWTDGPNGTALQRMADAWDPDKMDMLFLLQPLERMILTGGRGDYNINAQGRATRALDKSGRYMWTSVRLMKPEILAGTPDGPFSFLSVMDRVDAAGRLYGLVHDGDWHHISTPEDLERVNADLAANSLRSVV